MRAALLIALSLLYADVAAASVPFAARTPAAGAATAAYGTAAAQTEVVVDVRVYGNHTTPVSDILALTGPITGQPATNGLVRDVQARLERSGRFAKVEVRKRRLAIDNPAEILLVIVVDEQIGIRAEGLTPGGWTRTAGDVWAPMLSYRDGGYTYGARLSLVDRLGPRTRVSVPLTWGGERQARVEIERRFVNAPVARLAGGGGIHRSEHPFHGPGDTRGDVWARVESAPRSWLRARGEARVADVAGGLDDRTTTIGADLVLDTRGDPAEPQHAVYAAIGFKRLSFDATSVAADEAARGTTSANRMTFDGRGYLGVFRVTVLGVRAEPASPDRPMPPFEQALLGGIPSLRGSDAGSRANDSLAAAAVEMLVPIAPPTNVGQMGLKVFADAAAVYAAGEALADQQFGRGYGAGVFLNASAFSVGLDVGWPEQGGGPNAHLQVGIQLR